MLGRSDMSENAKHVLGITGGVGAGKSSVLACLQSDHGAVVIECDRVAARLQSPGGSCYGPMLELFPDVSRGPDGALDRSQIAARVFADPALLSKLNALVHPLVKEEVIRVIGQNPDRLVAVEAALLLEADYGDICDEIWYIFAREDIRADRLAKSRGYTAERIRAVMASQKDDAFYRSRCDYVIDNSRGLSDTQQQISKGLTEHGFMYDRQWQQR